MVYNTRNHYQSGVCTCLSFLFVGLIYPSFCVCLPLCSTMLLLANLSLPFVLFSLTKTLSVPQSITQLVICSFCPSQFCKGRETTLVHILAILFPVVYHRAESGLNFLFLWKCVSDLYLLRSFVPKPVVL